MKLGWLILVLWRLTFELWKLREAINAHPRIVEAHPEATEVHFGVLKIHLRAIETTLDQKSFTLGPLRLILKQCTCRFTLASWRLTLEQ
jgi:hypothetical protein